jgi:hypothetical protein
MDEYSKNVDKKYSFILLSMCISAFLVVKFP